MTSGLCITVLLTKRFPLRQLDHGGLAALEAIFPDQRHMWGLMDIPGRSNNAETLAQCYLERSLWAFEAFGIGMWGICPRDDPGAPLLGYTGYVVDKGETVNTKGEVEAGWAVAPGQTGRGVALEATASVFDFAFDSLGSASISAATRPDNHASRRLMDRRMVRRLVIVSAGLQTAGRGIKTRIEGKRTRLGLVA